MRRRKPKLYLLPESHADLCPTCGRYGKTWQVRDALTDKIVQMVCVFCKSDVKLYG